MYKKLCIDSDKMRGYKIKLYPTKEQASVLNEHINLFRYVYNWGLSECKKFYDEHGTYIGKSLLFTKLSEFRNDNDWMKQIPLHSARLALQHLDYAFKEFFKGRNRYPRFKSKKYSKKCVHYRNEIYAFNFTENSVRIPGFPISERIECKSHNVPLDVDRYYSCTITFDGINYWLSVNVERDELNYHNNEYNTNDNVSLGIDLGIKKFAQLSNGDYYKSPSILKVLDKRQRRQQSKLRRMLNRRIIKSKRTKTKFEDVPMTKNEERLKIENNKTRIRMKNIRHSFIHDITSKIVHMGYNRIVIEDLEISRFIHERPINNVHEITHSMWYKFREVLTYKARNNCISLVVANNQFPSSQICSNCGHRRKQSNRDRKYICHECGLIIDRDLNAALNLSQY